SRLWSSSSNTYKQLKSQSQHESLCPHSGGRLTSTVATIWANRLAPALLDRYLARTGFDSQQTDQLPPTGDSNLFKSLDQPGGTDHGAHGVFDDAAHKRSFEAALARHPATVASAVACGIGAAFAAKAALGRRKAGPA
ncbi:hypothetical protein ACFC4G_47930, partial [Streptomyces sp. NPDC056002]